MKRFFITLLVAAGSLFTLSGCGGGGGSSNQVATITERQFYLGQRIISLISGGVEMRFIVQNNADNTAQRNGYILVGTTLRKLCDDFVLTNVTTDDQGNLLTATLTASLVDMDLANEKSGNFFLIPDIAIRATLGSNPYSFNIDFVNRSFTYKFSDDANYTYIDGPTHVVVYMTRPTEDGGEGIEELNGVVVIQEQ